MTYCHPEFGCDCEDEIRRLNAEIDMLRLRLEVNTNIAVGFMEQQNIPCPPNCRCTGCKLAATLAQAGRPCESMTGPGCRNAWPDSPCCMEAK